MTISTIRMTWLTYIPTTITTTRCVTISTWSPSRTFCCPANLSFTYRTLYPITTSLFNYDDLCEVNKISGMQAIRLKKDIFHLLDILDISWHFRSLIILLRNS